MTADSDDDLSFAALDALLERALDLDEAARAEFLESLPPGQRSALLELLDNARSDSLERVRGTVKADISANADDTAASIDSIGGWQLKREIGAGGTGQVFYAERREAGDGDEPFVQRAAIKLLWSHRVASQFRERFLRERRILASIDHPGLARFLDGGLLDDGRPWFAMEYVAGDHIVRYSEGLPIRKRLALFLAVADTIDYAHQRLIVHRDIKPQNILVDELGAPRVLDFGIARLLGEFERKNITRAQGTPLTLQYASPEQVTGRGIAVQSDVYQLGLLLYEMLTGKRPYPVDESSLRDAVVTICKQEPVSPRACNRSIDTDLDAIVLKALRKKPASRYPSAAAMADDLRRYQAGRPITARPQSNWYLLTCFLKRNLLASSIAAVAFLGLAAATVFSVRQAAEARAEASRSRAAQEILADVFGEADPFGEGGANVTLADALVRAQPSIDARIADDPRLAWEVNRTLAGIFTNLDMLDLERRAFEAAWDAANALDGDNEAERLFAIAGIGNILVRTDPTEGVEFFAEHLPPSPSSQQAAEEWLSAKYAETSAFLRLREMEKVDRGAADMARIAADFGVESPRTLGRIDQLLAGSARRAGDIEAADGHWASAVANMRRADAPLALAVTLSNYALHYGMTERYDSSAAAFEESIDIFRNHETDNTSHANVLRTYAGLLFRMRRPDDAQAALDESLSILDPDEQRYAYFVAQQTRANFAFASDDAALAFDAIAGGLDTAVPGFGADSDVTRRMFPVFARLLLLAGHSAEAAGLVGIDDPGLCDNEARLASEVELASSIKADAPDTEAARQALRQEIDALARAAAGDGLASGEVAAALATIRSESNVFIDLLDRYWFIAALNELSGGGHPEVSAEFDRLETLKAGARDMLAAGEGRVRLQRLLAAVRPGSEALCEDI